MWLKPHHPDKFVGSRIQWRGHVYSPLPFVRALFDTCVNAGPWGTAPFPSVYRTDASPLSVVPHTPAWQVGAVLLLVTGALLGTTRAAGFGAALALAGVIGVTATVARCLRLALETDIRTLAPLPGRSAKTSRVLARALIAVLHVLQPLGRARGRLRGALTSPEFELAQDRSVPAPTWQSVANVLSFLAARGQALSFWSEAWLSRETLLTKVVERLRSTRVATILEVDGAWQRVRDVSLQLGRWGRLDVQMLVEEHERGRVLVRISRRLRVTPFFASAMTLLGVVVMLAFTGGSRWLLWALAAVVIAVAPRCMARCGDDRPRRHGDDPRAGRSRRPALRRPGDGCRGAGRSRGRGPDSVAGGSARA